MNFRIAKPALKTGRLLESLVAAQTNLEGVVCYGAGYSGPMPALNRGCSRIDKLEQARILRTLMGENAIEVMTAPNAAAYVREHEKPVLARCRHHMQGKDIKVCLEPWQVEALNPFADFYTPYLSSTDEWRTWIYRKRHLGSYKKVLKNPESMTRIGRNYKNGFVFEKIENENVPEEVKEAGRVAIRSLGLDFGAVDILSTPARPVVLEVNTAPGVQDERRAVIQKLATRIVRWAESGYPSVEA